MMANAQAVIDIIARDRATAVLGQVGDSTDRASSKMSGFKKAAVAAGALAGVALIKFGGSSIKAYQESEEAQKRLGFAFEKFPKLADTNQAALQQLNSELQKKTKYDDDAIASGQAMLAQFGVTGKQLKDTTPLMLDYASATGKDMTGASKDVGKALLGNAKALKNIGIVYTATGDRTTDFKNVTELMRKKIGGFSEKEATTSAGKIAIMKNQFGELQETVGKKLIPVLITLTDAGLKVIDFISRNSAVIIPLVAVVGGLVGIIWAVNAAHKAWTATTAAFNIVMSANPVVLVLLAIVALIAIVVVIATKTTWFQQLWSAAWGVIKSAFSTVFGFIKTNWPLMLAILTGPIGLAVLAIVRNWDKIRAGISTVIGWVRSNWPTILAVLTGPIGIAVLVITKHWDAIKAGASKMKDGIVGLFRGLADVITAPFRAAVDGLRSVWNSTIGGKGIPSIGIGPFKTPGFTIPMLASGGTARAGFPHIVGEHGPELFVPARTGMVVPNGALGGDTVVEIYGNGDPSVLEALIDTVIVRRNRRTNAAVAAGARRAFA